MLEFLVLSALLFLTAPVLGWWLADLFEGKKTFLHPLLGFLENFSYRVAGISPKEEMSWKCYLKTLLYFNLLGFVVLFLILVFQGFLPFNPQSFPGVPFALAFNIAASFVTNTNWQSYTPETSLSYGSQMLGLTVQNFLSAAIGICAVLPLVRGIKWKNASNVGNFWVDLVRSTVYLFLPLSILFAVGLMYEGVIQTFSPYLDVKTLEGATQTLPFGPVASQVAIKQLGTNGGGFFNANSAHPFENPSGVTNFFEIFAILFIPAALVFTFGKMVQQRGNAWCLIGVMFCLWTAGMVAASSFEYQENPIFQSHPLLEGKETRFGVSKSIDWSVSTTATANGSVNAMLDSLTPIAGGVALFNIMLGELVFGGVGVGLSSMLMFVLLTVFLAGLMVGRTPEYLGKKIERGEVQWVMVSILVPGALILMGSAIASVFPSALSSLGNKGPHGLSEIVYAFASAAGNNGSAFAGLNANTDFYNIVLGLVMIITRLAIVVPSLAIAGSLAAKKRSPISKGTFTTDSFLFATLLTSVILIVGALTFFPALCLGPIVEHFLMLRGETF